MLRQVSVTHEESLEPVRLVRTLNWALLDARIVDKAGGGPLLQTGRRNWTTYLTIVRALAGIMYDKTINMFFTMALAMIGALALTDFFEAAAIVFFFVMCEWVQKWCVHHTAAMTSGLGGLLPETVTLADGGEEKSIDLVKVGEVVLIKPGGRVPVDGTVVGEGSSSVDESMLTGESQPLVKAPGSKVVAGTTNQTGVLEVRVDALPGDSTAAQLSQLVTDAQTNEGRREQILERFAKGYTLTVVFAALLLATVPLAWCSWGGDDHGNTSCDWWLHRALALVVVACPCSLVVAMPITYACGVSSLARWGILVKSTRQMELLAQLKTVALDKTGTVTEGHFRLMQMSVAKGEDDTARVVRLASAVEALSSHPIAAAFLDFAQSLAVELPAASQFELLEGEGVVGVVDGVTVHVGSDRLVARVLKEKQEARGGGGDADDAHGHTHAGHGHDHAGGGGGCGEGCGHDHAHNGDHGDDAVHEHGHAEAHAHAHGHAEHHEEEHGHGHGHGHEQAVLVADKVVVVGDAMVCAGDNGCHHRCRTASRCKRACAHKGCCGVECAVNGCCGKSCCHSGRCGVALKCSSGTAGCCAAPPSKHKTPPAVAVDDCCAAGTCGAPAKAKLTLDSAQAAKWKANGSSVLWIVLDGEIAAVCRLADRVRSDSSKAVRALKELQITPIMLTGDCAETAEAVCASVGIADCYAGMKPQEKLAAIKDLKKEAPVGMVGDGVNDGPALAAADVGIAMGVQGTAMASQAAGVVLMTNDLRRLADGVVGARQSVRVLKISVTVALLLKLLPLVLIFSIDAEGFLIATAVGSDVLGIGFVLLSAMALMNMTPRFASTPCGAESVLAAPEVLKEAEAEAEAEAAPDRATAPEVLKE